MRAPDHLAGEFTRRAAQARRLNARALDHLACEFTRRAAGKPAG